MPSKKIRVPQEDGEIRATGGTFDEPRTWKVSSHLVTPANAEEREFLLARVEGARVATAADEKAASSSSSSSSGSSSSSAGSGPSDDQAASGSPAAGSSQE